MSIVQREAKPQFQDKEKEIIEKKKNEDNDKDKIIMV